MQGLRVLRERRALQAEGIVQARQTLELWVGWESLLGLGRWAFGRKDRNDIDME